MKALSCREQLSAGQPVPRFEEIWATVDRSVVAQEKGLSEEWRLTPELIETHLDQIVAEKFEVCLSQRLRPSLHPVPGKRSFFQDRFLELSSCLIQLMTPANNRRTVQEREILVRSGARDGQSVVDQYRFFDDPGLGFGRRRLDRSRQ